VFAVIVLAVIALAACKPTIGEGIADASTTDAPASDAAIDAPAPLGPWGTPTPIEITPVNDDDPSATGDLLELYFDRAGNIYVTTRASLTSPWTDPVMVAEVSSASTETTPEVSYDGLTLYFASNRAPTLGTYDIWVSTRATRSAAWGTPVRVDELSSTAAEGASAQTHALTIVLDTNRAGMGNLDIYAAERTSPIAPWGAPVPLQGINTDDFNEGNPMMTEDRLTLYFDSNRTGNIDIFVATRPNPTAPFSLPQRLDELSTAGMDGDPWISPDGRTLLFASNRDGTTRLWQVTR
jgi:hypothetical protein